MIRQIFPIISSGLATLSTGLGSSSHMDQAYFYGTAIAALGVTLVAYKNQKKEKRTRKNNMFNIKDMDEKRRVNELHHYMCASLHNLNNMLQVIMPSSQLLKKQTKEPQIIEGLELIIDSSISMSNLIEEMQYTLHEQEISKPRFTPYNISELEDYLKRKVPRIAKRKGIDYRLERFDLDVGREEICIDESFMSQLIWNMITNSAEANAIQLLNSYWVKGDQVYVSFRDNGLGMDEETRQRCLDSKFTTKNAKTKGGIRGIGLDYINSYLGQIGGEIEVRSKPGEGAEFILSHPIDLLYPGYDPIEKS